MADYQTIPVSWSCECGASGYDIVPSHDCPLRDCDECRNEYNQEDEGNENYCGECLPMMEFFLIDGYWKDSKEPFENYKVKETDEFDNGDDETVFFYGLSKEDILKAIEAGENTELEFVITNLNQ